MFYPNLVRWITKNHPTEIELKKRISATFRALNKEEKEKVFEFYKNFCPSQKGI